MEQYPVYKKLADKSFYKIVSDTELVELQRTGKKVFRFHLKASNWFDRKFILDLLDHNGNTYMESSRTEFELLEKLAE